MMAAAAATATMTSHRSRRAWPLLPSCLMRSERPAKERRRRRQLQRQRQVCLSDWRPGRMTWSGGVRMRRWRPTQRCARRALRLPGCAQRESVAVTPPLLRYAAAAAAALWWGQPRRRSSMRRTLWRRRPCSSRRMRCSRTRRSSRHSRRCYHRRHRRYHHHHHHHRHHRNRRRLYHSSRQVHRSSSCGLPLMRAAHRDGL